FRLYLNPYVTQTCFCLDRYVRTTWPRAEAGDWRSFLANGFDEALSGAIKLARYDAALTGRPATGLVLDPGDRLGPFAAAAVAGGGRVEFLPGVRVVGPGDDLGKVAPTGEQFGFVALVPDAGGGLERHAPALRMLLERDAPCLIVCIDRPGLSALRRGEPGVL